MRQPEPFAKRQGKVHPYRCAACKRKFDAAAKAERHIQRKHHGMGIIVWDPKK